MPLAEVGGGGGQLKKGGLNVPGNYNGGIDRQTGTRDRVELLPFRGELDRTQLGLQKSELSERVI